MVLAMSVNVPYSGFEVLKADGKNMAFKIRLFRTHSLPELF